MPSKFRSRLTQGKRIRPENHISSIPSGSWRDARPLKLRLSHYFTTLSKTQRSHLIIWKEMDFLMTFVYPSAVDPWEGCSIRWLHRWSHPWSNGPRGEDCRPWGWFGYPTTARNWTKGHWEAPEVSEDLSIVERTTKQKCEQGGLGRVSFHAEYTFVNRIMVDPSSLGPPTPHNLLNWKRGSSL